MGKGIDCKPCLHLRIAVKYPEEETAMTIKELETILDIPRATIRFYEKEGLISPQREGNGYRDYSEEDVARLKKIIILRKIGLPVNEIADIFDGAKTLPEALEENLQNLQKQMDELRGAMNMSKRMQEASLEIQDLDAEKYWNLVEEEEKHGNKFMTIAKDIAQVERGVLSSYFGWTSKDGQLYDSWPGLVGKVIVVMALTGCVMCLYRGSWNIKNFRDGIFGILTIMAVEAVLSIPMYFLGKKYPWIAKNRTKALVIAALLLAVVLLVVAGLFDL